MPLLHITRKNELLHDNCVLMKLCLSMDEILKAVFVFTVHSGYILLTIS
jgi:hypothetical protein